MTLLREVVAYCEWVLTQRTTNCPDRLLVSVLAISVQVCLDVVSYGFRLSILTLVLSFRFMCVLLRRGTTRCVRSFPTLRALSRALVPMVLLYIVCFALPGADAMEDSSGSGSSSDYSRTKELSSLSADTWEVFAFWFKNMAKLKSLVLPFKLPIDAVAPDPFDFGCLGEYGEVSDGEDPCEDAPEKPPGARSQVQSQLLVQLRRPFRFSLVGCLSRSSVSKTPLCMACWALRVQSV